MTDQLSFDRSLSAAFADAPSRAPSVVVDAALRQARTSDQRRPRITALDGRAWPVRVIALPGIGDRALVRTLLVLALVGVAIAAAVIAGAGLVDWFRPAPPPLSITGLGQLPEGTGSSHVVALPDGRILVPASVSRALAGIFDPRSGTTTTIATASAVGVDWAGLVSDGRVVLYGAVLDDTGAPQGASIWLVDTRTLTATQASADVRIPAGANVVATADGSLLLITRGDGINAPALQSSVDEFDLRTADVRSLPPIPASASEMGFVATALPDRRLLLVDDFGITSGPNADVRVYDPRSGDVRQVGRIHQDRFEGMAGPVQLPDGRWLVIGGEAEQTCSSVGSAPVAAYVFDPATDTLTRVDDLPHSIGTATGLSDGRVVLTGSWRHLPCGPGELVEVRDTWIGLYDPTTGATKESRNPMTNRGELPVDVAGAAIASVLLPDGTVALLEPGDDGSLVSIERFSPGPR